MPRTREQEAGVLYYEGAEAVRAGGHQLGMLASHLVFMIKGTAVHKGPLWPVRVLPDGSERRLERFIDYLMRPARDGLHLPSLHFLRQVLKATPKYGEEALALVRGELANELIDFDAIADTERDTELLKREAKETGRPLGKSTPSVGLSTGGNDRRAAQLAKRRPDLAAAVRGGTLKLSAALREAGIRKPPPTPFQAVVKLLPKLSAGERLELLGMLRNDP